MLAPIAILAVFMLPLAKQPGAKISEGEIKQVINQYSECKSLDEIGISHLEYFDFIGDGQEEAVVVAWTCMTGTAGPDVHAVYTRNAAGKVVEVPFHHAEGDPFFNSSRAKIPVFGNPNYSLTVEKAQVVARWMDDSGRETPWVVWYRWDGKEFVVDHTKVEGPFRTSYDCSKATTDVEHAICYAPAIAPLDIQLGQAYRVRLQQLPPDKRLALQEQQRQWLAEREKKCIIYKGWVDCLNDLYIQRIAELKQP